MKGERTIYEFGDFLLDTGEKELRKLNGEVVSVPPKAFELLAFLVENKGRLLEKNELLDKVWADSFVEEGNLKINVHTLRKIINVNGEEFIETIPRRGYRFKPEVKKLSGDDLKIEKTTVSRLVVEEFTENQTASIFGNKSLIALGGILILVVSAAIGYFLSRPNTPQTVANIRPPQTLAVLPFEVIGEKSAENEFLPEGIFETLTARLGKLKDLRLRSSSLVLQAAESKKSPLEIGKDLKVDSILKGSLQKSGSQVRVNLQMMNVADGSILWAETFEENASNSFLIQDILTTKIVNKLALNLNEAQKNALAKHYTKNSEAERLYIQGRVYWNERNVDGLKKSIEFFERALKEDPNYALAYVGLADSYQLLAEYKGLSTNEAFSKARINAAKALEIEPDLAEAHNSLAYIQAFFDWDFTRAEASFKRAIELNPNYATAHHWYSELLNIQHRFDESWIHLQIAHELDPFSASIAGDIPHYYFIRREYEKTIEEAQKMIEKYPQFGYSYMYLYSAGEKLGREKEAVDALAKMQISFGENEKLVYERIKASETRGLKGFWQKALEQAEKGQVRLRPEPIDFALAYLHLGDIDRTFKYLEKSLEERNRWLLEITYDPEWDAIRSDPRYAELVSKIKLNP